MRQKSPLLRQIPSERVDHLPPSRNSFEDGKVVDNLPFQMEASFTASITDCISNDMDAVASMIDEAAEQGVRIVVPQILGYVSRLSQAAGSATDAGGRQLSHDLITESLEAIDVDFDEEGNPDLPTLVAGPAVIEALSKLPPPTEDQTARYREMINRKREEFNARRRHRNLS